MDDRIRKLRRWNIIAGFAHLVQAIAVLALANDFTLPITASYMAGPPGTPLSAPVTLLDSRIGWGVALFFLLSAFGQRHDVFDSQRRFAERDRFMRLHRHRSSRKGRN